MKKSLVLFCLLSSACTTGGIAMHRAANIPSVTYDDNGERRCGLVIGHHKNWLGEEVPDEFVADINVWWGTAEGAAQAARIIADANARLTQEDGGFMLACAEANAIEMTAMIHAGRKGKSDKTLGDKVAKNEKVLKDLIKELQGQEKKAREGAAAPAPAAAPPEQPSGQAPPPAGQPQPPAQAAGQPAAASAAPAPAPDTACGKIVGAASFADLAAGLAKLASDTRDAEIKRRLVASATAVKAAGSAGGDLEAYKTSFKTSYCR